MPDAADKAIKALQDSPLPSMVKNLGVAIAEAQFAMDQAAAKIAQYMASDETACVEIGEKKYSLLELGFTPTFYQLTEATIEAKVAFTAAESSEMSIGASVGVNLGYFAASVNASYSAKYSFEASGSSSITARFVSIPPPTVFAELLRSQIKKADE